MEALTRLVLVIALPIIGIVLFSKIMRWKVHTYLLKGVSNRVRGWLTQWFGQQPPQQGGGGSGGGGRGRRRRRRGGCYNSPSTCSPPRQQGLPLWRTYKRHEWKEIGKKQSVTAWFVENCMASFIDVIAWPFLLGCWISKIIILWILRQLRNRVGVPLWNYVIVPIANWVGVCLSNLQPIV